MRLELMGWTSFPPRLELEEEEEVTEDLEPNPDSFLLEDRDPKRTSPKLSCGGELIRTYRQWKQSYNPCILKTPKTGNRNCWKMEKMAQKQQMFMWPTRRCASGSSCVNVSVLTSALSVLAPPPYLAPP